MSYNITGKSKRNGITLSQLFDILPDEESARKWFEARIWPKGRYCPRCGSTNTHEAKHRFSPYRCRDCKKYFSVKTGSAMEASNVPLRKWALAIYLDTTSLKGVASTKLARDIGVQQRTAWFMLHRIREGFTGKDVPLDGPVEVDETYIGGKRKNVSNAKRRALKQEGAGRGSVGKAAVVGVKDRETKKVRAEVVSATDNSTLQGFIQKRVVDGATVYTDDATAYRNMHGFDHEAVKHSVGEYVRDMAHTNGIESFWSMLKRGYVGTYHWMSAKHLQRYVNEFAGRHGMRELDTADQFQLVATGMVGKRIRYDDLIAPVPIKTHAVPRFPGAALNFANRS